MDTWLAQDRPVRWALGYISPPNLTVGSTTFEVLFNL